MSNALSILPRVAVGYIFWTFISSSLLESAWSFQNAKGVLLNTETHEVLVVYQLVWRNMVVFAHNLVVVLFVFVILERRALLNIVFLLPILGAVALTLVCPIWLISRLVYRIPTLRSLLPPIFQFLFFLTPILWTPSDTGSPNVLIEVDGAY
jgi:ABC-2 type transport system permease protein